MALPAPQQESSILDCLGVGVFAVDPEWTIVFFNREAERITGFSRSEALGRKCWDVFHTEYCNRNCHLQEAIRTGRVIARRQVHYLTKDNCRAPLEITSSALCDAQGGLLGGVQCFSDRFGPEDQAGSGASPGSWPGIEAHDPRMIELLETVRAVAATDASILLTGETGAGKDVLARAIHAMSPRRKARFVKVNCAALPDKLIESELFGYRKGAFTDARRDKLGLFELAEAGTIFLDEIGDLALDLQAKLLQALEDRQFYPLGASRPVRVNVRVLSATNVNLAERIARGEFRPDLYYRLRVLELYVPPLRQRPADLVPLAESFLARFAERYGKQVTHLDESAKRLLLATPFPGNIRELKHVIEHAVILSTGRILGAADLKPLLQDQAAACAPRPPGRPPGGTLLAREREVVLQALAENEWSIQKTAESLDINRITLWRRMRKYGI